ncbi:MAG TPA: Holliday junction branch migration protein RuvA [Eggerthellaceae bacterium]|nr:Holliday junction branch migration protein RuvA [Eggerthellaceae bacterium]
MIAFLDGTVAGKTVASAFVNVGGVGFEVGMSQASLSKLPATGEHVVVHTHLQVRDDGMSLFGFLNAEEKALFEKLITVSGVGPKVALAALSSYAPAQLADLIAAQDVAAVQRIPGIGKKTASRIILELKGSLDAGIGGLFAQEQQASSQAVDGAKEALLSMGFTTGEIDLALKGAPDGAGESALLQYALKKLGS